MTRHHQAISFQQAARESPVLARLTELALDSRARLKAIEPLVPAALLPHMQAGPIDDKGWCLIVDSSAAAAKIRQLLPALEAHLRVRGWEGTSIRVKVQIQSGP